MASDEKDLAGKVTDDVGGVQGEVPAGDKAAAPKLRPGSVPDQPPPDSGEIEWAGTVAKKPPSPNRPERR